MAALPEFDTASKGSVTSDTPGFEVTNQGIGPALKGISSSNISFLAAGVVGINNNSEQSDPNKVEQNATGVVGISINGEGVHGESRSTFFAGVAGIQRGPADPERRLSPVGVFGFSENGEGMHGESRSDTFAAIAGISKGPVGNDPQGNRRNPCGVFGQSESGEGVHGETSSSLFAVIVCRRRRHQFSRDRKQCGSVREV